MKDTKKKKGLASPKLPKKVVIDLKELDDEIGYLLGDYLSDTYGYCHYGFTYAIKGDKVVCSDIDWDTSD